jgi:hypothetical protein
MNRDDIIRMAREVNNGKVRVWEDCHLLYPDELERFAALVRADERNKLAAWMIHHNLATGHGDTMEQLCDALGTEIVHRIDMGVESEREACAEVCEDDKTQAMEWLAHSRPGGHFAAAIRARGQA